MLGWDKGSQKKGVSGEYTRMFKGTASGLRSLGFKSWNHCLLDLESQAKHRTSLNLNYPLEYGAKRLS